jgi:hypothetical protein
LAQAQIEPSSRGLTGFGELGLSMDLSGALDDLGTVAIAFQLSRLGARIASGRGANGVDWGALFPLDYLGWHSLWWVRLIPGF